MLPCQRHLFDIPAEVVYLNAASMSPLPKTVIAAGIAGALRKGRPWSVDSRLANAQFERARAAAARIIGAEPSDIAIIPSVSYGVAVAGKILDIPPRSRILVMADDHSSPVLEWMTRAVAQDFSIEVVAKGDDWTNSLIEAVERPGTAPVSLASISSVHWGDGSEIGLEPAAEALRKQGAALLIDATQSAGVLPLEVASVDPDFVVFPTYKWLLGPYGRAFLYVAKRRQLGVPLEQPLREGLA